MEHTFFVVVVVFEAKRAMEPWPLAFSSNPGKKKRNKLNFSASNRKTLKTRSAIRICKRVLSFIAFGWSLLLCGS